MRSSATAGLSPQQQLDRRRAQNKLAQRRFREKARMSRSAGSTASASFMAAASAQLTFPLDLNLAAPLPRNAPPRVRSGSSGSSASSSVSLSSQVSSPTSTCTELSTPVMPSFNSMPQSDTTFLSNMHVPPVFKVHESKSDLDMNDCVFCMPSPSHGPQNYGPFNPGFFQPASSEQLTYPSSASSYTYRNTGLKIVDMHSDPFLMSQSLPSPSLLFGLSGNPTILPNTTLFSSKSIREPQNSFEDLLVIPSRAPTCSDSSDVTSSDEPSLATPQPSFASRSNSPSGPDAKPINSSSSAPFETITIALQSFARIVEQIGSRFGLTAEGLPQLLSRLQLSGKPSAETESGKGLVFDAAIDWDALGCNMLPTTEQLLYPHRAFIDACLPWPVVRSRLLTHTLTNPVCEEEFALDLLLSVLSSDGTLPSFHVYGDDILDPEAWELSERTFTKWWGLFDDSIVRRTNWWRRQRGLEDLTKPAPNEAANESEQQGLGTGSLDEFHRLASTLSLDEQFSTSAMFLL
ncbi:uncharacterized protein MEPE_03247 [Melanopsichium pennsylvanicum]|uniref:BZIP domain-containing protein n=2 Tax=Melanopsichium pennsylvanicum TaxID=63383 RepID=A0AAJ5C5G3_9BASI|nr:conserved hypothetical protein [Melanopsichium pennsylvanicum 4]SNX84538.1 uncharacterized protein MEPE_03247 [Melanopsichium pennsylvanicum]